MMSDYTYNFMPQNGGYARRSTMHMYFNVKMKVRGNHAHQSVGSLLAKNCHATGSELTQRIYSQLQWRQVVHSEDLFAVAVTTGGSLGGFIRSCSDDRSRSKSQKWKKTFAGTNFRELVFDWRNLCLTKFPAIWYLLFVHLQRMSPALRGSFALQGFKRSNTDKLHNRIKFDFHPGLPHMWNMLMYF